MSSVLFTVHLLLQLPARGAECWITFRPGDHTYDSIFLLIINCVKDLPLIINPLGILTLRSWNRRKQSEQLSDTDENLLMISTESKEFEDAFFKAKTTTL